ncbi:MAG: ATP-binding cassette domain-containing protein [Armatimonadetes bacterium]|nr:ATP-binding cassette domain-containing protein [Armatimonadota bacterium]
MPTSHTRNVIEVEGLTYTVDGRTILADLAIAVSKAEIVGVVGASGSGKSTLIKCLAALTSADAGSILINGRQIVGMPERKLKEVRSEVGFVFQYSALFDSMTVFENIALAPMRRLSYTRTQAMELVREKLQLVQLDGVQDYYPGQLSGGMAKRVGLARALALEPAILFYDEPTSGLDPPTARSIDELIVDMRRQLGVTSVVVSHDVPALARIADRIALLDGGKIAVMAPPQEFVRSDHPVVRQFVSADNFGIADAEKHSTDGT